MNENLCLPSLQINFQKICRTCLIENEGLQGICRIVDLLKECTSIHVNMEDDLPKLICVECTQKLNIAFLFRKQCELSEKTLLQLREFKKTPVKLENENLETNEIYIKSEGSNDLHEDNSYTCNENNTFKIKNVLSIENTYVNENKNTLDDLKISNSNLKGNYKTAKKHLLCDFDDQPISERLINEHKDSPQEDNDYKIPNQNRDESIDSKTNKSNNKFKGPNRNLKIKIKKLKEKTNYNTINDDLVCLDCEKTFELEGDLEIHMLKHQKFDDFICPKCSKSFANRHNLRRHLNTHMVTKPFKCKFCDKSFAAPGDRNRHLRLHTGEKPYICPTCGKAYTDSSRLSKHMKYHSDVKDFACKVCPKSFLFPNALRVHMRVHTGEKPYLCTECGDNFKSALSLKTHERKHTRDLGSVEEESFCCNICGKILTSNQILTKHKRTHVVKGK